MIEIPLTQGYTARISDKHLARVSLHKWFALVLPDAGKVYAGTNIDGKTIYMHVFIAQPRDGMQVDHWDNNGLNNTDENLRVCTRSQNQWNRGKARNNTLGYKGIHRTKKGRYYAQVCVNGHRQHVPGLHDTPEAAARAYDTKALELFGEFARLNFPTPQLPPADAWSRDAEPKPDA